MSQNPSQAAPLPRHRLGLRVLGALALLFGAATLLEGGRVLFGPAAAREGAGDVVGFVLLFNFSAGFLYIIAGVATLLGRAVSAKLAALLFVTTLLVFAALALHIAAGRPYEARTVVAMTLRTTFWLAQAVSLLRIFRAPAARP